MPSRPNGSMTAGRARRGLVAVLSGAMLVAAALVAMSVPASGHEASIFVDCHEVVVGFSGFPPNAIPVHIAVQVGDVGSKSSDVMVDQHTSEAKVDISDLTASVQGPITVHVDVTWTFDGPQERQKTAQLVCNETGSSSTVENASSTSIGGGPTSSVEAASSTSTPVTAGGSTTSIAAASSTNSMPSSTSTSFVRVSAASASSSLPFTGGASLPLLVFGLALIAAGAAFVLAPRRRASRP